MGRLGAATADGNGDDGSPGCSGGQVGWVSRPEMSCSQLALIRDCFPASSYGTLAKTPEAAEEEKEPLNTC